MNLIEEHYRANFNKLVKLMTFRSGTEWDAQDIVQEAYARAIEYYGSFNNTDFNRWFRTVLNNSLRAHKNDEKGYSSALSFDEEDDEGIPCSQYNEQINAEIDELIQTKSLAQIEVLTLHFQKGYPAIDISKVTDHGLWAIHKMISRFRDELKELYK